MEAGESMKHILWHILLMVSLAVCAACISRTFGDFTTALIAAHEWTVKRMKRKKKWCIYAEGVHISSGLPIIIHQKDMAENIHEVWTRFRCDNYYVSFNEVSIKEVKQNERSQGISGTHQMV